MSADWSDDTPGMMRVHIAAQRADLACKRYTRGALRAFAKGRVSRPGHSIKRDLAWQMAQDGLIDADGRLRDGFPKGAS
jgi:hypothetical protein